MSGVIAPEKFSDAVQPLETHKIGKGMTTKLVMQEDIWQQHLLPPEGRDWAEEMKILHQERIRPWETNTCC